MSSHVQTYSNVEVVHQDSNYFKKNFEIVSQIGQGNFGKVYTVFVGNNKTNYKVMKRMLFKKQNENGEWKHVHEQIKYEGKILNYFNEHNSSPFIMKSDEIFTYNQLTSEDRSIRYMVSISEFIDGISLDKIIYSDSEINDKKIRYIVAQLLSGIRHLTSINVVHFDIKPANIMLDYNYRLKIIDFGTARVVDFHEPKDIPMGTTVYNTKTMNHISWITYNYDKDPTNEEFKSAFDMMVKTYKLDYNFFYYDIWCAGCVLFELYHRKMLMEYFPRPKEVQTEVVVEYETEDGKTEERTEIQTGIVAEHDQVANVEYILQHIDEQFEDEDYTNFFKKLMLKEEDYKNEKIVLNYIDDTLLNDSFIKDYVTAVKEINNIE